MGARSVDEHGSVIRVLSPGISHQCGQTGPRDCGPRGGKGPRLEGQNTLEGASHAESRGEKRQRGQS